MDEIWINKLCRDMATQIAKEISNSHKEDDQETLNRYLKEIAEVLENIKWGSLVQEVIKTRSKRCAHCKKDFPISTLSNLPGTSSYGSYCHECYPIMLATCQVTCAACRQKHFYWEGSKYFCNTCNTQKHRREIPKVQFQNKRAEKMNLAGTLTISQWIETLNHFDWRCAYCHETYNTLEHYNPLPYEGTTQKNCIPSCNRCNGLKKDYPPEMFERIFPAENMRRIKEYQASLKSV